MTKSPTKRPAGFTLIELLVVIAIICLLAGILFPVFASARESGKKVTCLSNLRQLTSAHQLYVNDYDDTLCAPVFLSNLVIYPWQAWFGQLDSPTSPLDPSRALLAPYLHNTSIFNCPDIDVIPNPLSADLSYGINDQLCITTVNIRTLNVSFQPVTGSQVQVPSETVLFGDAAQNNPGPRIDKRSILQFNGHFAGGSRGFLHARHGGSVANISWLDGHAKAMHLSYNTRNDSTQYTAAWEEHEGIGDLLKNSRQYAQPTGTTPSLQDMYYYLTDKSVDPTIGLNTVDRWLLL
jgi:prepilin-type N-terminal cleavage/methylation domain-containing protein/prepilin-type processing-associated H-X9-DG protein